MKKVIIASLVIAAAVTSVQAATSDIMIAKNIKPELRTKIERDLNLIDSFKFKGEAPKRTLEVMGLSTLNAETASGWLNQRVNYIISEKALSLFNLLFKRVIFVEKKHVDFPNSDIIPYSMDKEVEFSLDSGVNQDKGFTVMSNIGSALYLGGKNQKQVYGFKVSRGFLRLSEKVAVTSPRAGIIQIGEGLFAPELTINRQDPDALANSIFRLGTFFHEARHSDGNGKSLGFMHMTCPKGHDYEGQPACDESLNGPYTVGALMMTEMAKACEENCSEKDKSTLKMLVLDSANRIMATTHRDEAATD